jgi:hypothetical protein
MLVAFRGRVYLMDEGMFLAARTVIADRQVDERPAIRGVG